ncbi:putative protein kinase UbiB [subsurface metagenome]
MGQILSLRPDIIPPEYAQELEKLQDKTPPVPFQNILEIIENEFAANVDDVFRSIDEAPVASGSVAQVHRATLKNSGETVAVKVLKPKTREIVETDLSIIGHLVRLAASYIPELEAYNPIQTISEFSEILLNELNFLKEANTIERFSRFFKDKDYIHIPKVYKNYTTNSVMVMEFIDGIKVSNVSALEKAGMDRKAVAENGAEITLREIFEFGFYHADPHPGNIFVLPGNTVAPVDFGITGYIDEEGVQIIGNILFGLIEGDADKTIRYLKRYNFITDDVDVRKLKIDLIDFMDGTQDIRLSQINVSSSIGSFNCPKRIFLIIKLNSAGRYFRK